MIKRILIRLGFRVAIIGVIVGVLLVVGYFATDHKDYWSGKLGGEAEIKTDNLDEVRRLYPFFLPQVQSDSTKKAEAKM